MPRRPGGGAVETERVGPARLPGKELGLILGEGSSELWTAAERARCAQFLRIKYGTQFSSLILQYISHV